MKLKELLIFVLWILTEALYVVFFNRYSVIYSLSVVVLFESYIFFRFPYSEYFWNADQFAEDLEHKKIRIAAMGCIVAFLIFVLKWNYFFALYFITAIKIDGIINFFRVSKEEKRKVWERDGRAELKSYFYLFLSAILMFVVFIGIGAFFLSKHFTR